MLVKMLIVVTGNLAADVGVVINAIRGRSLDEPEIYATGKVLEGTPDEWTFTRCGSGSPR